jgi:sterol desaturase/sphingolipid hydroxylase (fatty acid hydroxylase superfamily)
MTVETAGLLRFSFVWGGFGAFVTEPRAGVLALLDPPRWVRLVAVVAFMDCMLYVWHLLNHEMPLLWRFHRVHHSDLNMDVSTATRFHIGELAILAAIKLGLVLFLGVTFTELLVFEILLVLSAQFQHSVVRTCLLGAVRAPVHAPHPSFGGDP